jgi:hypothetical protein
MSGFWWKGVGRVEYVELLLCIRHMPCVDMDVIYVVYVYILRDLVLQIPDIFHNDYFILIYIWWFV